MVRTPINLVRGLIRLGLIKDLNLAITVRRPLEWLKKGLKERWSCRESNPGPLAYRARLRSLIRPSLISPRTKLIGVLTIGLPALITLKIPLNQQSYAATILIVIREDLITVQCT